MYMKYLLSNVQEMFNQNLNKETMFVRLFSIISSDGIYVNEIVCYLPSKLICKGTMVLQCTKGYWQPEP